MKKVLIILAFFLSSTIVYSQWETRYICLDCPFSIEVGGVASTMFGLEGAKPATGFNINVAQENNSGYNWSFVSKLSFVREGAYVDGFARRLSLTSAFISFNFYYYLNRYREGLFVFGAPVLGSAAHSGYMHSKDPTIPPFRDRLFNISDDFTFVSFDIMGGVGYAISDAFEFSLTLDYGVTDIYKKEDKWHRFFISTSFAYWYNM